MYISEPGPRSAARGWAAVAAAVLFTRLGEYRRLAKDAGAGVPGSAAPMLEPAP